MNSAHVIFEVNQTKIRDGCQSGRKVITHDAKSDLPIDMDIRVIIEGTEE